MLLNNVAHSIIAGLLIQTPNLPEQPLEELFCLTEAIYFEARNQNIEGMAAVGLVVRNRVENNYRGSTYCEVVKSPKQYSYRNGGNPEIIIKNYDVPDADKLWWSLRLAIDIINNDISDFTNGSMHYYNPDKASPIWKNDGFEKNKIGDHYFLVGVK